MAQITKQKLVNLYNSTEKVAEIAKALSLEFGVKATKKTVEELWLQVGLNPKERKTPRVRRPLFEIIDEVEDVATEELVSNL